MSCGRLLARLPWPGAAILLLLHSIPLICNVAAHAPLALELIPQPVMEGQVWRLLTGHLVQLVTWTAGITGLVAAGLFGREIEQNQGTFRLGHFFLLMALMTGAAWVLGQAAADAAGLRAGMLTPLSTFPAVTAMVGYVVTTAPLHRLAGTGYRVPGWLAGGAYTVLTLASLLTEPAWTILLPAHVFGMLFGSAWAWWEIAWSGKRTARATPFVVAVEAPLPESLEDADLDEKVDLVLRKVTRKAALTESDQAILREASRRKRKEENPPS